MFRDKLKGFLNQDVDVILKGTKSQLATYGFLLGYDRKNLYMGKTLDKITTVVSRDSVLTISINENAEKVFEGGEDSKFDKYMADDFADLPVVSKKVH
jgi:hypothetical protein